MSYKVSNLPSRPPVTYRASGYGLTETSPTTHVLETPYAISKIGSIGTLLPNLEARLVVDGDGNGNIDAEEGQPGELWVRGPSVMKVSSIIEITRLATKLCGRAISIMVPQRKRRSPQTCGSRRVM